MQEQFDYIGKLKKCKTATKRHKMHTSDLANGSLKTIGQMIRKREVSPVEVVEAHLERIARLNPELNAIVTLAPDVLDRAKGPMTGGSLHGVPITIKDT